MSEVYPRVCGGTYQGRRNCYPAQGLSPRVRGNRLELANQVPPQGSIPACAGEPLRTDRLHRHRQVYPRVCGGTV